jgi:hypothetical protein
VFYICQVKWLWLQCHDLAKTLMRVHQLFVLGQFALCLFLRLLPISVNALGLTAFYEANPLFPMEILILIYTLVWLLACVKMGFPFMKIKLVLRLRTVNPVGHWLADPLVLRSRGTWFRHRPWSRLSWFFSLCERVIVEYIIAGHGCWFAHSIQFSFTKGLVQ